MVLAICVSALLVGAITLLAGTDTADIETQAAQVSTTAPPRTTTAESEPTTTTVERSLGEPSTVLGFVDRSSLLTSVATTTSTTAPEVTSGSQAVAAPTGPAPVRIPTPSCAAGLGGISTVTAPLTGLTASIPSGMPAVVVKVSNNSSSSRAALIGLDQADIVYEERIEANATRFAAVFHSNLPANVGPVRSGRTTDIDLIRNLNTPVLGYSGSNDGVAAQIRFAADNGWMVPFVNTDRAPFARDSRYSAPENLFVDPASLGACGNGGNVSPIFSHSSAIPVAAQPASSVSLSARSSYRFDWNAGAQSWDRSQSGSAHSTREGVRLSPENVVVMFVPYVQSNIDKDSVDAITAGSGEAWIFRDGTATIGTWSRPKVRSGYTFTASDGSAIALAPGQSWVVLAPAGSASWS